VSRSWTAEAVLTAAAQWIWVPYDAVTVANDAVTLVVQQGKATVHQAEGDDARAVLDQMRDLARRAEATSIEVGITDLTRPVDLAGVLLAAGGEVIGEYDVSAHPLDQPLDLPVPADIDVVRIDDPALLPELYAVGASAFGTAYPSDIFVREEADTLRAEVAAGGDRDIYRFLGRHDGRAVACAGVTFEDSPYGVVAKLWGGAVVPDFRGRGAYRAVLHARLELACARGATLALVKAKIGTSSPILRRVGFTAYGRERRIRLALP
jgi:GNAT superfamily N-acetyltransferase